MIELHSQRFELGIVWLIRLGWRLWFRLKVLRRGLHGVLTPLRTSLLLLLLVVLLRAAA